MGSEDLDIESFFALTSEDILCNTSYPLSPCYFSEYRTTEDIMRDVTELSFYFHIPFCRQLCRFCEYTRFLSGDIDSENEYVEKLKRQTLKYLDTHTIKQLYGFDIGGGTPTALNTEPFANLLSFVRKICSSLKLTPTFESSIEFSFSTINEEKIDIIAENKINRVSTGIQVYDDVLMSENGRVNASVERMKKIFSRIRDSGIGKINLDLMYGFSNQTKAMLESTMLIVEELCPDHVTFYEMRYNMNNLEHISINREQLFDEYLYLFNKIKILGYQGNFGQNAFSLCNDKGVSSYLYSRMYDGISYKGFGVSAQSMSSKGISYNTLKSLNSIYIPKIYSIAEQDVYILPADELAAKYVCIGLYGGQFSLKVLSNILKVDAYEFYSNELLYLLDKRLIAINNDVCVLTRDGFRVYGAVASLFWSKKHKHKYVLDKKSGYDDFLRVSGNAREY